MILRVPWLRIDEVSDEVSRCEKFAASLGFLDFICKQLEHPLKIVEQLNERKILAKGV